MYTYYYTFILSPQGTRASLMMEASILVVSCTSTTHTCTSTLCIPPCPKCQTIYVHTKGFWTDHTMDSSHWTDCTFRGSITVLDNLHHIFSFDKKLLLIHVLLALFIHKKLPTCLPLLMMTSLVPGIAPKCCFILFSCLNPSLCF